MCKARQSTYSSTFRSLKKVSLISGNADPVKLFGKGTYSWRRENELDLSFVLGSALTH
ncbi:hypothetical protein BJ997_004106 [Cryobacterium roopkundense]|uniref:Uncharacterized protein n=1 Tax=Cryobacterium roopkundense TaxID=1001240 RepID=A0A7W9A0U0_9MICO|nr:hypothetical protein [Cryobacterium roopkundense]